MQTEIRAMRREISLVLKLVLAVKLGRGYHLPLSLLLRYGFFGLFDERGGWVGGWMNRASPRGITLTICQGGRCILARNMDSLCRVDRVPGLDVLGRLCRVG